MLCQDISLEPRVPSMLAEMFQCLCQVQSWRASPRPVVPLEALLDPQMQQWLLLFSGGDLGTAFWGTHTPWLLQGPSSSHSPLGKA